MNYRGLSLRDLQYVVAVAETRNFGRAARACATSQPTLSLQIRKVEMALGVAIFDRNRRTPTTATAAGLVAVRHMRAILAEATGLLDATAGLAQPLDRPVPTRRDRDRGALSLAPCDSADTATVSGTRVADPGGPD